jgi:hypothetical protein
VDEVVRGMCYGLKGERRKKKSEAKITGGWLLKDN